MSLATVYTRACLGVEAPEVSVEVHLSSGLPALNIVGLPETAVKESKDRVRSALINAGFEFPTRRITVNLAPADLPKEGGRYDLPIALGILVASGQLPENSIKNKEFLGELSLTGVIRKIRGVFQAVMAAKQAERILFIPQDNSNEVRLCKDVTVFSSSSLLSITAQLSGKAESNAIEFSPSGNPASTLRNLSDVKGQFKARRGLEIAAAGGHGLLMFGPPGTGKTLLAECLPGIQPEMTENESMEVAAIYSLVSGFNEHSFYRRPFRSPHHTASSVAMVGGGSIPKPGEITLAHHGVLFLDELPEFDRKVLEVLRQPMESGEVTISRAARQITFPARFQLIAAMNPCPCGYFGDKTRLCKCTPLQVQRYRQKISGPLLDRIDMHVEVSRLPAKDVLDRQTAAENSAMVKDRVDMAVTLQKERQGHQNARMDALALDRFSRPDSEGKKLLIQAIDRMSLSVRAIHRLLRVARTIADLAKDDEVNIKHLAEALSYRGFYDTA